MSFTTRIKNELSNIYDDVNTNKWEKQTKIHPI